MLQSELSDPTLTTETIRVRMVLHVLTPIYRPGTVIPVVADDMSAFREYLDFLTNHMNQALNCELHQFDGANFQTDRLFSTEHNKKGREMALYNQKTYVQLKTFVRRMNVLFVPQYDECEYHPDWNDFQSNAFSKNEKKIMGDHSHDEWDQIIDAVVKGYRVNPKTNEIERVPGVGKPAKDPAKAMHVWIVNLPESSNNENSTVGYAVLPDSAGAGTPLDGVVMSARTTAWDQSTLPDGLNQYMTLSHEIGHWLSLVHIFDKEDQVANMPEANREVYGNLFELDEWPRTNGEPHNICNIMGYGDDPCISEFTLDQCIKARNVLRHDPIRKQSVLDIVSTPDNIARPIELHHPIPTEDLGMKPPASMPSTIQLTTSGVAPLPMQSLYLGKKPPPADALGEVSLTPTIPPVYPSGGLPWWVWILIALAVIAVIGSGAMWLLRRKSSVTNPSTEKRKSVKSASTPLQLRTPKNPKDKTTTIAVTLV